jgi:hypothetical protein
MELGLKYGYSLEKRITFLSKSVKYLIIIFFPAFMSLSNILEHSLHSLHSYILLRPISYIEPVVSSYRL